MIAVDMERAGTDQGDCWRACLASVLEVDLHDVPDFVNEDEPRWLTNSALWLEDRGYVVYTLGNPLGRVDRDVADFATPEGYTIHVGTTGRGKEFHAVVCHFGAMVHDPHPSRAGIDTTLLIVWVVPRLD